MPTDPALSKRLAEFMGYKEMTAYRNRDGEAITLYMRVVDGLRDEMEVSHWHPDTDIAQSKMLLDKIGERFDWTISYHQENKEYCVELFFPGHYRKVAYESLHRVLETAICRALDTVLSEDKK
jgi:hypothetical protein